MKKQIGILIAAGVLIMVILSFRPDPSAEVEFPEEIATILQTSCFTCHSTGSNSDKALEAVNFEDWDAYRLTKKVGLLGEIGEVLEEGKMPPARFLERNPDKGLSDAQKKLLIEWTGQEADKLMQGN